MAAIGARKLAWWRVWQLAPAAAAVWVGTLLLLGSEIPVAAFATWAALTGCVGMAAVLVFARNISKQRRQLLFVSVAVALAGLFLLLITWRVDAELQAAEKVCQPQAGYTVLLQEYQKSKLRGEEATKWAVGRIICGEGNDPSVRVWLPPDTVGERWAPGTVLQVRGTLKAQPRPATERFTLAAKQVHKKDLLHRQKGDLQKLGKNSGLPGESSAGAESKNSIESSIFGGQIFAQINAGLGEMRASLREISASQPNAELLPGFAVGDTALVPETTQNLMQQTGLTHLIAVSGSNCALVIVAVSYLAGRCRLGRRSRIVLAAAGLIGFALAVGPDPSLQRAAVMAGVMLAAKFGGASGNGISTLAVATAVLLLADPWQAIRPGFALSVAATLGILLWAKPVQEAARRVRLPDFIGLSLAVTVTAQCAVAPLLLLLQPNLVIAGLPANLLAAPIAPFLTAIGLLALLLAPVFAPAAQLLVAVGSAGCFMIEKIAEFCASLPFGQWFWPGGVPGAVLLALAEGMFLFALIFGRKRQLRQRSPWLPAPKLPPTVRWARALAVIALCCIAVVPLVQRFGKPQDWAVIACDVGQGDGFLLRNPAASGAVMAVDTGDNPEKLQRCIDDFQITSVSLLVLSHDDKDHVGALHTIAPLTKAAYISPPSVRKPGEKRPLLQKLAAEKLPAAVGSAGQLGYITADGKASVFTPQARKIAGDYRAEIAEQERQVAEHAKPEAVAMWWHTLGPPGDMLTGETNAMSLAMRVHLGQTKVLLLGDSAKEQHSAMLRAYPAAAFDVDIIKIAHHGSADQDFGLAPAASAQFGLVSCGLHNSYGHPRQQTMQAYYQAGTAMLRTDLQGHIAISPEQKDVPLLQAGKPILANAPPAQPAEKPRFSVWTQRAIDEKQRQEPGKKKRHNAWAHIKPRFETLPLREKWGNVAGVRKS
ncbi:MAG: ComEC/Rec2 family competence protein [Microbacteriaceae bacterium]|nr:ComEC/Rec2 family competence protein [Microbacteriaceae bacterium]